MDYLVWIGSAMTLLGLVGVIASVFMVLKAKRENLDDDALRARLNKILPVNIGSLLFSMLGLAVVIVGIFLN